MESGDVYILVYDYAANMMYVSSGEISQNSTYTKAYSNIFLQLNMTDLFTQTQS